MAGLLTCEEVVKCIDDVDWGDSDIDEEECDEEVTSLGPYWTKLRTYLEMWT